jgi:methionine aminotransferase
MKEIKYTNFGFSVNSICQVAISEYLDIVSINKISSFYQEKKLLSIPSGKCRFKLLPCEGTYFQVASYETISKRLTLLAND